MTSYRPRHRRSRRVRVRPGLLASVALLAALAVPIAQPQPAYAGSNIGNRILDKAETRTGDWYSYGAAGPGAFDCSGLVYWAAGHAGARNWPRDTFSIAKEIGHRFIIVSHPQRGDLALWGPIGAPYHVEFVTRWRQTTFGAQNTGTRVAWHYHYPGWRPDFYLRILW